jgi:hypothetical protein
VGCLLGRGNVNNALAFRTAGRLPLHGTRGREFLSARTGNVNAASRRAAGGRRLSSGYCGSGRACDYGSGWRGRNHQRAAASRAGDLLAAKMVLSGEPLSASASNRDRHDDTLTRPGGGKLTPRIRMRPRAK